MEWVSVFDHITISKKVLITVEYEDGTIEVMDRCLYDGIEWKRYITGYGFMSLERLYGNTVKVLAWMNYPKPYGG